MCLGFSCAAGGVDAPTCGNDSARDIDTHNPNNLYLNGGKGQYAGLLDCSFPRANVESLQQNDEFPKRFLRARAGGRNQLLQSLRPLHHSLSPHLSVNPLLNRLKNRSLQRLKIQTPYQRG